MWARALGWAAGWKYFLREFGPLHTLVRPQPLCGTGKRGHCLIFHEMGVIVMVLLLLVLVGSLLSFPPFLCFPSLPFCSFRPFYCFRVLPFPSLRSVPLTAIHSWHSIFCLPFPTCPSFPPLPSSSFISFQFSPSFPACFPAFPLRYFRVFPFLLSHHHVHYYQREHTRWGTVRGTVYAPLCRQYVFGLQVLAPSSPIYPPNLILKKGFRSEAP